MTSILYNEIAIIAMVWILGIIGFLANGLIFFKAIKYRKTASAVRVDVSTATAVSRARPTAKNQTFGILVINLAIADFIGSIYLLILAVADVRYRFICTDHNNVTSSSTNDTVIYFMWLNNVGCYAARFINITSVSHSTMITWLIALDRFLNVIYPFSPNLRLTAKRAIHLSTISLLCSMIAASVADIFASMTIPFMSHNRSFRYHNLCSVDNLSYLHVKILLLALTLSGSINYFSILFMYFTIWRKLRYNKASLSSVLARPIGINQRIERKILFVTAIICCTSFLVWIPSLTLTFITVSNGKIIESNNNLQFMIVIIALILQSSASINPIVLLLLTHNNIQIFRR
ncbi:G-protein coupled receptor GRL101-like protein [Trichoplax sp. H2]|nr:G-protein coupled receptor GRL101-like protein [Trichoplax sp. H2]|eukprot:RDD39581.1 G-protein coupled receptor GRL101-like protein [Trichoplax sp. H2]